MNTLLRILSDWKPQAGEVIHIHAFKAKLQYSVSLKVKYRNEVIVLGFYIDVDTLVDSIVDIYNTLNSELEKSVSNKVNNINDRIKIFE